MRKRDYYWSLYHTNEKNQIDNLRTDHVEVVFSAIPQRTHGEWWIWREGLENWKPFTDFPVLLLSLRQVEQQPIVTPELPAALAGKQEFEHDDSDVDMSRLTLMKDNSGEDRAGNRFKRSLDVYVLLSNGTKSLLGKTVDVSLRGMSMQNPLPGNLPAFFSVEIRKNHDVIPLVCSVIKSKDGTPSKKMRIEANEYLSALLTLLLQTA